MLFALALVAALVAAPTAAPAVGLCRK